MYTKIEMFIQPFVICSIALKTFFAIVLAIQNILTLSVCYGVQSSPSSLYYTYIAHNRQIVYTFSQGSLEKQATNLSSPLSI